MTSLLVQVRRQVISALFVSFGAVTSILLPNYAGTAKDTFYDGALDSISNHALCLVPV